MFKKNFFLLCALTAAYAPVVANAPETMREEDVVDLTKGGKKKCCRCCSLTVTNNASIGGNLSVGGSVTASSFILSSGDTLFNGLRNWAVFSNQGEITAVGPTVIPFSAVPLFNNSTSITNAAGVITLPTSGVFLVMYTARVNFSNLDSNITASAQLQQGAGGVLNNIGQPAVVTSTQTTNVTEFLEAQISGYAIITTAATATNNQIDLTITLPNGTSLADVTGTDANAEITILQLN